MLSKRHCFAAIISLAFVGAFTCGVHFDIVDIRDFTTWEVHVLLQLTHLWRGEHFAPPPRCATSSQQRNSDRDDDLPNGGLRFSTFVATRCSSCVTRTPNGSSAAGRQASVPSVCHEGGCAAQPRAASLQPRTLHPRSKRMSPGTGGAHEDGLLDRPYPAELAFITCSIPSC